MLPTFVWSVPVNEKKGRGVTVLISTIHFHRRVYAFVLARWCFAKWKESLSAVYKGKWKCMQSTLYLQSTLYHWIKQFAVHLFVLGEFLCIYKFITLPLWNLVTCTVITPNKFHSHHFCPTVRNHVETFHLLLLLLSGKYFNELNPHMDIKIYFCTKMFC